ncbi:hypothetical protein BDY21DRAFT_370240 [Lineolata rhizophorae]|uniref:LEA domain protein n=1 Tax=Lineolata rhizophorae TaxID=578093 RepID=A0A6A6P6S3_9PEZI|nr:hypothetical protein BDY21DRAFT_370240 [Lineolata rhizophorae]
MLRAAAVRSVRAFSTARPLQKSAADSVKDTAKKVDRTISDAAVKGIEKGEQASQSVKSTVGLGAKEAKGEAKEAAGEAKGKTHEMAGKAKGAAEEMKSKV